METAVQQRQMYDLLILADQTNTMRSWTGALNQSLPSIIAVSALTGACDRIGVLAYRDYSDDELTEWSGWYGRDGGAVSRDDLMSFAKYLEAGRTGSWLEARKTGLARAYSVMRPEAETVVIIYTDAPPHMRWFTNGDAEKEKINLGAGAFGPSSALFIDWVSASRTMKGDGGGKQAKVFAVVQYKCHLAGTIPPYMFMCHRTRGNCFHLGCPSPDPPADIYLGPAGTYEADLAVEGNLSLEEITAEDLQGLVIPRPTPAGDCAKRYREDEQYRKIVVEHLRAIIRVDVFSLAANPVFGRLWRVIFNDRALGRARGMLISGFGASIERIRQYGHKDKMKAWLAESYNYAAEIVGTIEDVSEQDRFPCVFLDPTQDWAVPASQVGEDEKAAGPANVFTRAELLEIARSCHFRILRRLGQVLMRLTYVQSEDKLPAHIKDMTEEQVPRIPVALAKPKYRRRFWKILLHAILPGTKLAARPAALLAALSIRMGIIPLIKAADLEMLKWRGNWNNLKIPETWNTNCLCLILDADKRFEERKRVGDVADDLPGTASFLAEADRQLFERLVDYSLLRANMGTNLTAKVGWTPEKAKVSIGPLVVCKSCKLPRSVTVMADGGICGICAPPDRYFIRASKDERIMINASKVHTSETEATWVECSD